MLLDADPHARQVCVALIQSLFREVNEQIESASRASSLIFHEFSCECADENCTESIPLTIQEYEHVRHIPTHFVVKSGHVYPDVEQIVETDGDGTRFVVVEKFGQAALTAVELDPRSS
jgi:hypothetical protein